MFKNLSLKNRIALFYSFTFSIVLLIIFAFIYYTVNYGINKTLYEILKEETNHHFDYVLHEPTLEHYVHPHEWEEVEHTDVALNPVFIAIYNQEFQLVENSPNLVQNKLEWNKNQKENAPYLANYNTVELLISQTKLIHHGEVVGYLVVGVSTKHNQLALGYLKTGLMIIFPLSIVMIFISARLIAGQSTKPVFSIIKTAKKITENNLSERIILPKNKDELYLL
jgi:nitrogen fixation/metabolism regulation signal transduction histidine kinase